MIVITSGRPPITVSIELGKEIEDFLIAKRTIFYGKNYSFHPYDDSFKFEKVEVHGEYEDLKNLIQDFLAHYYEYLDDLRESGIVNMINAVPYLESEFFELSKEEARVILLNWIKRQK